VKRCLFYGLGSDGTVGANKNSIKIIGENPRFYAQGYFVYDSKKAGAHVAPALRTRRRSAPATSSPRRNFLACHQWSFLERYDMLQYCQPGGVFLLNSVYGPPTRSGTKLPAEVQKQIIDKKLKFYVIDAYKVAERDRDGRAHQHHHADLLLQHLGRVAARRGHRQDQEDHRRRPTQRKGPEVVQKNFKAVDHSVANL
jgi:pyruvate-ferredoxin/flavodoxin oxidoreductase